jgi:hypothetical protein
MLTYACVVVVASMFHLFLPRAQRAKDPIERMKNVVSCFVAGMCLTSGNFLKPLNPILGETLQVRGLPPFSSCHLCIHVSHSVHTSGPFEKPYIVLEEKGVSLA